MISEWKEFRLGDITEWASGGTPSKQNADFWNGTIPWISASSMGSNRYNESDLKITQEGLKAGSRLAKKDSILLLVRGSTLHQRIPVGIATSDVSFNQDVKAIRAKEEFIDPWYLLFWFMAKEKDLLNMVENTGIGAGKLDTNRLQNLLIRIPPDSERNKILLFAKALDDKLLLNRQINQTLEALAQAIFKSWFVDFEPVKAKIAAIEAGEDVEGITRAAMNAISGKANEELDQLQAEQPDNYTQLKTTAELFPTAMQDSELGEIPEGWEVNKVDEILELAYGKPLKEDTRLPGNVPVYGSNGQIGWHNQKLVDGPGIVVGRKGNPGTVTWVYTHFYSIDTTFYVIPKGPVKSLYYLLYALKKQDLPYLAADSAVPGLNRNIVYMNKIIVPQRSILDLFDFYLNGIYQKIHVNKEQSRVLESIRDSLLPKLLSGELSVDAAKLAEEERLNYE